MTERRSKIPNKNTKVKLRIKKKYQDMKKKQIYLEAFSQLQQIRFQNHIMNFMVVITINQMLQFLYNKNLV